MTQKQQEILQDIEGDLLDVLKYKTLPSTPRFLTQCAVEKVRSLLNWEEDEPHQGCTDDF